MLGYILAHMVNCLTMKNDQIHDRFIDMLKTALGSTICEKIQDPRVIEIMHNPNGTLFIDYLGQGIIKEASSLSPMQAENILKLVASYRNAVINDQQPEIATELPLLNARFQGWLPPVVKNPSFVIRCHASTAITLDNYVKQETMTLAQQEFIIQALQQRKNIIVSGGTSSGKTTLVNALLHELNHSDQRLIILEDLPELRVLAEDVVLMRTTDTVTMRQLVKGTLRMRPDRIIIGEVRDGAALDLLKAWNTGHPGGICTLHANSCEQALQRIESLIQEVTPIVPQQLIAEAIDVIIQIERDAVTQQRQIVAIAELGSHDQHGYHLQSL